MADRRGRGSPVQRRRPCPEQQVGRSVRERLEVVSSEEISGRHLGIRAGREGELESRGEQVHRGRSAHRLLSVLLPRHRVLRDGRLREGGGEFPKGEKPAAVRQEACRDAHRLHRQAPGRGARDESAAAAAARRAECRVYECTEHWRDGVFKGSTGRMPLEHTIPRRVSTRPRMRSRTSSRNATRQPTRGRRI